MIQGNTSKLIARVESGEIKHLKVIEKQLPEGF